MGHTTISHFSFLISHSNKAFIRNPWAPPPHGLTLNLEPRLWRVSDNRYF